MLSLIAVTRGGLSQSVEGLGTEYSLFKDGLTERVLRGCFTEGILDEEKNEQHTCLVAIYVIEIALIGIA